MSTAANLLVPKGQTGICSDSTEKYLTVPIDPLAPEHTYRDVDPFLRNVYRRVLDAHDSKSIVFMGDSAGGGLALGLCHPVREDQV